MKIGLLHPGQMGSVIGAAAVAGGAQVSWVSGGRSSATRQRAEQAGFNDLEILQNLVAESEIILSVCPPESALALARSVAECGFNKIFVDANAISPGTAREIQKVMENAGADFVDGGIIGPPPVKPGITRLYLSGAKALEILSLFTGSNLEAIAIDDRPGAASAMKMCYAAYTKGSTALMIAIRALAQAENVDTALVEEWNLSQQGLAQRSENAARNNAYKAWRFAGEMREIADYFCRRRLAGWFSSCRGGAL